MELHPDYQPLVLAPRTDAGFHDREDFYVLRHIKAFAIMAIAPTGRALGEGGLAICATCGANVADAALGG